MAKSQESIVKNLEIFFARKERSRWADLKKLLSYTGDIATLTETGEIVEGVTVYETPGIFTVDV